MKVKSRFNEVGSFERRDLYYFGYMIPLKDTNRPYSTPIFIYVLIISNVAVFLYQLTLPDAELINVFMEYGMRPSRVSASLRGDEPLLTAILIPSITSIFLHGGWMHLLSNMWFLRIFGDNVEDAMGRLRFIALFIFSGLFANMVQFLLNPGSDVPVVGASGAIAGVLGAYVVMWPGARILTLVPVFYLITFVHLPALIVLGGWFLMQIFMGIGSLGAEAGGGVAYGAHIGGFICGLFLVRYIPLKRTPLRLRRKKRQKK